MRQWFSQFTAREQLALVLLSVAVGLYLLFMLAWSPLAERRDEMALRNQGTSQVLQRVEGMVAEIGQLRAGGQSSSRQRNLTSLVNQSTRQRGLDVSRLQPNSRGEIQVRLEEASFDALMLWLHDMEYREGLLLSEVAITQGGGSGRVNATIRIAQGA